MYEFKKSHQIKYIFYKQMSLNILDKYFLSEFRGFLNQAGE